MHQTSELKAIILNLGLRMIKEGRKDQLKRFIALIT